MHILSSITNPIYRIELISIILFAEDGNVSTITIQIPTWYEGKVLFLPMHMYELLYIHTVIALARYHCSWNHQVSVNIWFKWNYIQEIQTLMQHLLSIVAMKCRWFWLANKINTETHRIPSAYVSHIVIPSNIVIKLIFGHVIQRAYMLRYNLMIHWSLNKLAAILKMAFSNAILKRNILNFEYNVTAICW